MNYHVRQILSDLIDQHSLSLCGQPKRCKGMLLDHCAGDRLEVFVLISALEEQVVADLLEGLGGKSWGLVSSRLVRRLMERRAMAEEAARWAGESWALALGLISEVELVDRWPGRQVRATKSPAVTSLPGDSGGQTRSDSGPLQASASDAITTRVGDIGMKLIPAGEFRMGSPDSDSEAFDDEKPQHKVQISRAFYLGEAPVTQAQYKAVLGVNPSRFRELPGDHPVEMVSWFDAVGFCNELSRREGLRPFYVIWGTRLGLNDDSEGYRLPTEAEWEYACRAGSERRYCFGDGWARLGDYAWYSANSQGQTCPVRRKRANAFGLYDMHGNIWEWCFDAYDRFYYRQSPDVDPLGMGGTTSCVVRGGSWNDHHPDVRAGVRYKFPTEAGFDFLGFRIARGLPSR